MLNGFVIGDRSLSAAGDTHPVWLAAHGQSGAYLAVGASAAGQQHLHNSLPRDDAFVIRQVGPWLAIGVSDGVGSRPLSRYGATYVAESLTALLLRPLVPQLRSNVTATRATSASAVPPVAAEAVEFKPLIGRKDRERNGAVIMDALRTRFLRRKPAEAQKSVPEMSSDLFQQAASIGWWPYSGTIMNPQLPTTTVDHLSIQPAIMSSSTIAEPSPASSLTSIQPSTTPNLSDVVQQAFEKTHRGLRGHADHLGVELADLSCTGLALLFNVETGLIAIGQIGDGAMLGLTTSGNVKELITPVDTGDPQSVYTINRPNFDKYLAVQIEERPIADPFLALFVMTDGLSGDLLYSPEPEVLTNWAVAVDRNLRGSPTPAQAAAGMLNWLAAYQVKGSWDDRTLVVITRKDGRDGDHNAASREP